MSYYPNIFSLLGLGAGVVATLVITWYILYIVAGFKIFEKAGEEGWKSIIPFYNLFIMTKIQFGTGWLFLLYLIPPVGAVFTIIADVKMAQAFQKGIWFTLGLIFLGPLFRIILGFDDSVYIGPQ